MLKRLAVITVVLLPACSDGPMETGRAQFPPLAATVANVPHFSFLPPLAEGTITGEFNPDLRPVVEICRLVADECAEQLVRFETAPGGIEVSIAEEHYKVNWQIGGVAAGELYRILVRSAPAPNAAVLGAIDLLGTAGGGLSDPTTGASRNVQSTLPIKFRIEEGILCTTYLPDPNEGEPCLVMAVGPEGGTFVTTDELTGTFFPPGAVTQYVTLIIERYEPFNSGLDAACLPSYFPQYGGCYRYRTDPYVPEFEAEVTVGVCPDPAVFEEDIFDQLDLYKWDEVNESSLEHVPEQLVEFLNCPGTPYYAASLASPASSRFAAAGRLLLPLRQLVQLVRPAPLYAGNTSPFGGKLNDFSRIGWLRPLAVTATSGDGQSAYLSTPVPDDPVFRVTAAGAKVTPFTIPVAGVPLQFSASGDGTAVPGSALTDADGYATTVWTVGTAAGTNTLTAYGRNPLASESATDVENFPNRAGVWGSATITATAVEPPPPPPPARYNVVFTEPLQKGKLNKNDVNVPGVAVVVRVCSQVTAQCSFARRVVANSDYRFQWKADSGSPDGKYTFSVLENGTVLGSFVGAVAKDGSSPPKGVDFTFQLGSNVPIKFFVIAR